jgi:hypothetical protein
MKVASQQKMTIAVCEAAFGAASQLANEQECF